MGYPLKGKVEHGFFAIPNDLFDLMLAARMKPASIAALMFLWYVVDKTSSPIFRLTDLRFGQFTGLAPGTLASVRHQLAELKLVQCEKPSGASYEYSLWNPYTNSAYPPSRNRPVPPQFTKTPISSLEWVPKDFGDTKKQRFRCPKHPNGRPLTLADGTEICSECPVEGLTSIPEWK